MRLPPLRLDAMQTGGTMRRGYMPAVRIFTTVGTGSAIGRFPPDWTWVPYVLLGGCKTLPAKRFTSPEQGETTDANQRVLMSKRELLL